MLSVRVERAEIGDRPSFADPSHSLAVDSVTAQIGQGSGDFIVGSAPEGAELRFNDDVEDFPTMLADCIDQVFIARHSRVEADERSDLLECNLFARQHRIKERYQFAA